MVGRNRELLKAWTAYPHLVIYLLEEPQIIASWDDVLQEPLVKKLIPCHYQSGDAYMKVVEALIAEGIHFEAVIPGVEYAVPASISIAHRLGLRHLGLHTRSLFSNKFAMRKHLKHSNVLQPDFVSVKKVEDLANFLKKHKECVLKPANRQRKSWSPAY